MNSSLDDMVGIAILVSVITWPLPVAAEPLDPQTLPNPSRDVPAEWLTTAERTEFRQTPRYDETIEYCRRLANASDWIDLQSFGVSPEGRDLALVIASSDRAFTSAGDARRPRSSPPPPPKEVGHPA
ncbi:MAG: hypothetical protein KJ749_14290 [Planctomycetes bacterium]|nr:hypothetical protein [Planctomycetota bacterium]